MEQPLISVIIPVYNVEKYLRQCLDSIINQTLKNIEIICIDDGSTDSSLKILQEYKEKDNRFVILTQKNQYAGVARNNGLKIAKGKYVIFLDGDDFFELIMLNTLYKQIEKDQSDIVISDYYIYDNTLKKIKNKTTTNSRSALFSPFSMGEDIFNFTNTGPINKLFKTDFLLKNEIYFEPLKCCNDFTAICTALAAAKKISVINKPLMYYRSNQKNNTTAQRKKDTFMGFECDVYAVQALYKNLVRLNLYQAFKKGLIKRSKRAFKDWDKKHKEFASKILSDDLYYAYYNEEKLVENKLIEHPLVSIVSLVYDTKIEYVNQCVDSLLKQTYDNIEIIFMDDCSPHISYEYLTKLSPKIRVIRNEKNLGFNRNTQKSFEEAKGKYIVKIDSDDYIDPTLIEKEVTLLETHPDVGAVACELQRFGKKKTLIKRPIKWSLREALFGNMGRYGYEGGMMFRASLLNEIAIDPNFRVCTDFDFNLQILEKMKMLSIHEPLYYYRSHDENIMISARGGERIRIIKEIKEKHKKLYELNHKALKIPYRSPVKRSKDFIHF